MKKGVLALALLLAASTGWAKEDDGNQVSARLEGDNEVPAVSTPARGRLRATIDETAQTISYELSFDNLQAAVRMAHIHFAQKNVNGGIMVWLCQTTANPAPGAVSAFTPTCPQSGSVSGTIPAAGVLAIGTQSIAAGNFAEFVSVLRKGLAYVNLHTEASPGGEIRGQVKGDD